MAAEIACPELRAPVDGQSKHADGIVFRFPQPRPSGSGRAQIPLPDGLCPPRGYRVKPPSAAEGVRGVGDVWDCYRDRRGLYSGASGRATTCAPLLASFGAASA